MKYRFRISCLLLLTSLFGCVVPTATIEGDPPIVQTATPTPQETTLHRTPITTIATVPEISLDQTTFPATGYTHQRADGNRFVAGSGQLPDVTPTDIPLPGLASWVVAIPWDDGSLWVVTLEDGQVLGFQINAQGWQPVEIAPSSLETGQPPLLFGAAESPALLTAPSTSASPLTHAIPLFQTGFAQTFIDINRDLILVDDYLHSFSQISVNALPDARILSDEHGRLLLLTGATEKYEHGVLGDSLEATSITRIDDPLTREITTVIEMPDDLVIEGITPIWADLNGDGVREIIVTVSNAQQGAQILVFSEDGQQLAAGPAIGQGYRWRHQIAVAPFGPNGELELVDVLTPHLGGVVEFYRWEGDQLKVVAQLPGYTSHVIGTRNLDMAAAGDFDGDGKVELLLPNQSRSELGAIRRTRTGASVAWSLPLDGRMTTNLGAVSLPDGSIAIGIGQENGILPPSGYSLRIWHP